MDEITMTQRWVGSHDSAAQAAGEFVRVLARRPCWWGFVALVEVGYALFLGLSIGGQPTPVQRVLWGVVYALVPTICIVVLILGLSFLVNRRRFRVRLHEGVVLEAGIGGRSLTLRSPWAEHVLSFDGLSQVMTSGDWVFIKQKGVSTWGIWPAELFPPDDLGRLQRGIAGDKIPR